MSPGIGDTNMSIYVVLAVALAIWIALFIYLWRLDLLAQELRRKLDSQSMQEPQPAPKARLERRKTD